MEEKSSRAGGGVVGGPRRRCRYGAECRNKYSCKFYHPPGEAGTGNNDMMTRKPPNQKNPEKRSAAPKRDRSKIQCRYGMECRNTKCPFFHHPAATAAPVCIPVSPTRASTSSPNDATNINNLTNGILPKLSSDFSDVARNGIKHPSGPPPADKTMSPPAHSAPNGQNNATATPPRKATTKKKCRWGAGCRNKRCTFLHPGQQVERDNPLQSSRHKLATGAGEGTDPTSHGTVLPPPKAARTDHGTKNNDKVISTRLAVHSILPPSPAPQEPLDSAPNTMYPTSLLFPPSESDSHFRDPFQASSMPVSGAHASDAFTRFNSMFAAGSNTPPSGFSDDESGGERTPLYDKCRNNPHPPENHEQYCQPASVSPVILNQDQPPDTDWLFEVLGLNDTDVNGAAPSQERLYVFEDVFEETYANNADVGDDVAASVAKAEQILPVPISEASLASEETHGRKLVPEEEIVQSRRAALELRLESQQNAADPELLSTLLRTCRSKQEMIKTALERSMDSSGENGSGTEIDETNVVALLELNELLVGAIDTAESSLCIAKKNAEENGKHPGQSRTNKTAPGSGDKERDSSWKPVNKKTASATAKTKKSKHVESPGNPKKSLIKSSQPSKPAPASVIPKQEKPDIVPLEDALPDDESGPSPMPDPADTAQQEKEKMARMLEEARKQAAVARERKKSKKSKKFDRWLKQNEEARENRAKFWTERIAKEKDYIDLIQKLIVAEFLRQSKNKAMGLTAERVMSDPDASEVIAKKCREAYHTIFAGLKSRVVVAGLENKDMNGRQGTIRYWDRDKEKFCVGLDTKKSSDSDVHFLTPETLDLVAPSRPLKSDKKSSSTSYGIDAPELINYGGVSLGFSFTLQKSHVVALGSAESTKVGLEAFCKSQDAEERRRKREEAAEKKREEEDRKRRASRRAQENAAWEKRKEQMRRDKEEYEKMKREWAKERGEYGGSMFDYDDDDEECQCPRCRFGGRFGDRFSSSGGAFFFNIGGIPFRVRFDSYDSDEDSFFDEFDERWEEQFAEEKEEENRKQADTLGVDPDADARTIKLAYRKMALQFHPDKWKSDSGHGMSRKDAENRFKSIQNAYDHLMSNFDD